MRPHGANRKYKEIFQALHSSRFPASEINSVSEPSAATTAVGNGCKSSTMLSGKSLSISSDVPFLLNGAPNHGALPTLGNHKESHEDRRSARSYASQLSEKPDGDSSFSSGILYSVNIPVSTEQ